MKNKYTFEELWNRLPESIRIDCDNCEQNKKYHSEGVVTQHIRLVFNFANTNFNGDVDLLLCAIFHDLGKPETVQIKEVDGEIRISNIGHEMKCVKYIDLYFDLFSDISTNKDKIIEVCENHMKAHLYETGLLKKPKKRQAFEELTYFNDIMNFLQCDAGGRE
jgi:hypothetical protein